MTTKEIIRCYAGGQPDQKISRKGLLVWMQKQGLSRDGSGAAISLTLNRMLQSGELAKLSWGTYSLNSQRKRLFIPIPSEDIRKISQFLNGEFPYTCKCVWNPEIIVPFMQHIPNLQMLIVEVERIAMEPVFNYLQGMAGGRRVIYNPTLEDCAHYVSGFPSIIVKPLVSQAPLIDFGGICIPAVEKVMVDIIEDVEYAFAQGAELFTIFESLKADYDINFKALYRYADRRGRRKQIESLLKPKDYDTSRKQGFREDTSTTRPLSHHQSDTD